MLDVSDLIGIKYKINGRHKEEGFDCYGLAIEVEKRLGHNLRDVRIKNNGISDEKLASENIPTLNIKPTDYLEEGTLIEMYKNGVLHVGVALNQKLMIHATENQGVRISPIGFYQIKGIYKVWEKSISTED